MTTTTPRQESFHEPRTGRLDPERLRDFGRQVFRKCGMTAADAEILTDHLVWADLRGIAWLGANKIPQYVARLRSGATRASGGDLDAVDQRAGFLVFDAEDTFAQVVGYRVMKRVIETARTTGVSAAVIRNTTSGGALGYFSSLAVEENMIGIAINNGSPHIPAPGGAEPVVGNQAFAVASPAGKHPPLVLDMATSMTLVRIYDHLQRGAPLPEGVALSSDGKPTVDPAVALKGMLLPMGGHRGFAISVLWEVLTGVLAGGATFSTRVGSPAEVSRPQGVSMFLLALDPTVSMPYETYISRVDDMIDRIHGSRRLDSAEPARVPGERAAQTMLKSRADGIELPESLLTQLQTIAAELDVPALT